MDAGDGLSKDELRDVILQRVDIRDEEIRELKRKHRDEILAIERRHNVFIMPLIYQYIAIERREAGTGEGNG